MIKDIEEIKKIINYSDEFQDFLSEEFELKLIEICNFINKNYSLVLIICRAGLKVSAVEQILPATKPSASPILTIIVA